MENIEKKNEVKRGKYIKVYTRTLANHLINKGFLCRKVEASEKDPKKLIWFFDRTPETEQAFEEYINKPKTSANAEDTNK